MYEIFQATRVVTPNGLLLSKFFKLSTLYSNKKNPLSFEAAILAEVKRWRIVEIATAK